jgi:CheY-like chemotaxis protein
MACDLSKREEGMSSIPEDQALAIGVVDCAKLTLHSRFLERRGHTLKRTPGGSCSALVVCEDHVAEAAVARWGRRLAGPKLVVGADPPADWRNAARIDRPLPIHVEQRILSLLSAGRAGAEPRRFDVVVVGEDATIRAATADALAGFGLSVRGCAGFTDLRGALLVARPDFILLEPELPGISRQLLGKLIRARNIPTAVFASVPDAELQQAQAHLGAVTAFAKATSLATIGRWVRSYLERSPASRTVESAVR